MKKLLMEHPLADDPKWVAWININVEAGRSIDGKVDNLMNNKNDLDLSMNQSLANKFERLYKEEKSRRQFAEKELQEVKDDNKKLSLQISDMINKLRDAQF